MSPAERVLVYDTTGQYLTTVRADQARAAIDRGEITLVDRTTAALRPSALVRWPVNELSPEVKRRLFLKHQEERKTRRR